MKKWFEIWIGNRYVRSRSDNRFVSLISAISMAGIAIAVMVLIIVLSVVNGFERELKDRLLAMTSHANIEGNRAPLDDWQAIQALASRHDGVVAAAPYVSGQGLMSFGEKLSGVELRGIDPAMERGVSGVGDIMVSGSLDDLETGSFNVILGIELAKELDASVGDKVTMTLAAGVVTPAGVTPRTKRFTVSGVYRVGMFEFDRRLAFVNMQDAQRLFRLRDKATGVRLSVEDIYAAPTVVREVALASSELVLISDWTRRNVNFFRSIQITKSILFVILLLVIGVAAFNIVSTLVMVVKDKQGDIAILRTIGASPFSIVQVFVTQGCVIGFVGTLSGVVLGVLVALNLESIVGLVEGGFGIKLLAADVYFISDLPSQLKWSDVGLISGIAFALALLSTLYPAYMASRTAPAEALRYD